LSPLASSDGAGWSSKNAKLPGGLPRNAGLTISPTDDALTGLANRRQFETTLKATIAAPPGADSVHALLILDLNGFKTVNDVYGHAAGDEVLVIVAQRLAAVMRDKDMLARLGGDEFAVIAAHLAGPESATGIALRIIKSLEAPIELGSCRHRISIAIGIAVIPQDGTSAEEVLRKADLALYKAKTEKRSTARFFEAEMDRHAREREFLERELAVAIETHAIQPWYQPIMDLRTEQVVGFEALARWTHNALGPIPPERFIPIAEDTGLMCELSDYLLRCACIQAKRWPAPVTLSFNISPTQLRDRTLGLRILSILGEVGLPPQRLEIEVTESALVRDLDAAREVLQSLRKAGVRVALDDFGTGYSSLYHLRNFKFDDIKIDRSFIAAMGSERESAAIVRALTGLGNGLGMTITAEGVENWEQCDVLLGQGCTQGQGFLFSRAVPGSETQDLIARCFELSDQQSA
jgi:diguanylate cyclase (GGDEF)-like protein